MGNRRKHLTGGERQPLEPPTEGQRIVRAVGPRGGNIVEVEYPGGRSSLCLLPAKFNKTLWIRKGGYLVVEESPEAVTDSATKVTGTVVQVLYDDHVKQLRRMEGVWPPEFMDRTSAGPKEAEAGNKGDLSGSDSSGEETEDDLPTNTNRKVVHDEESMDDDEEEEEEDDDDECQPH